MLILKHLEQIEDLTGIKPHQVKPVKFGLEVGWNLASQYVLAAHFVPDNVALLVLRVECVMINQTVGAADFNIAQPAPSGKAYWTTSPDAALGKPVTNANARTHVVLDVDELLIFAGNQWASVVGDFNAPPDADTRQVRTTVYGYYVPSEVVAALVPSEAIHQAA